jgi:regulatory protein
LTRKLAAHGDAEEIASLLDDLQQCGQLSDVRYTEALVHARAGRHGSRRLAHELREKGVEEVLVHAAVEAARHDDLSAARGVWAKKFGIPPANAQERARQFRFLLNRGFPPEVVRRVVGGTDDSSPF